MKTIKVEFTPWDFLHLHGMPLIVGILIAVVFAFAYANYMTRCDY